MRYNAYTLRAVAIRTAIFGISLLGIAACSAASAHAQPTIDTLTEQYRDKDLGRIMIVAHRGCWSAAPENTVAAMQACVRLGVEAVEIDVQLTRDGEVIVFHDTTLKRMTNGFGYVGDKTLAELRDLRLFERDGSPAQQFNRPLLTNTPISTLEEVLDATRGKLMINLEIKTNPSGNFSKTFAAAVELVRRKNMEDHVFWKIPPAIRGRAAPDKRADTRLNALNTEGLPYVMPIVWQSERAFIDQITDFEDEDIHAFEIVAQNLDYWPLGPDGRIIGSDKNRYMIVGILPRWGAGLSEENALNDPDGVWGKMIDLGADLIMTDRPEQLMAYLEERGFR